MRFGMSRQKPMTQSQTAEIESLQKDLEATQDYLTNWAESNLDSIDVVYVDVALGHRYHR